MNAPQHNEGEEPSTGRPLSTLVGDRLCIRCGYNLVGQPVVREPHYSMLIVRCPECGTVASVQEYPLLGRWAGRWAALLAAAWFAVCIGLAVASAAIIAGLSESIATRASQPFAVWMSDLQREWLLEQQEQGTLKTTAEWLLTQPAGSIAIAEPNWLAKQDAKQLLAQAGSWSRIIDVTAFWGWTNVAIWAFAIGVFWSVALLRAKRWTLLVAGALLLGLTWVAFSWRLTPVSLMAGFMVPAGWQSLLLVARQEIGPVAHTLTLSFAAISLAAGLLLGRQTTRGLVRAFLPPRLRGSLAILWTADGKPPPPGANRLR